MNKGLQKIISDLLSEERITLNTDYEFPKGFDSGIRLKHILEDYIDEKYYLSNDIQERFLPFPNNRMNGKDIEVLGTTTPNPYNEKGEIIFDKCTSCWVYNTEKNIGTLSARDYKQPKQIIDDKYYLKNTKDFFIKNSFDMEAKGNGFRFEPHVKDNADTSKCITTRAGARMDDNFIIDIDGVKDSKITFDSKNENALNILNDAPELKIRKLTPLECWRLQGFDDEDFYRAKELGVSDSQLYKQAGNSITVNVLYYQFKELFKQYII